jgi:hypothetical protein
VTQKPHGGCKRPNANSLTNLQAPVKGQRK